MRQSRRRVAVPCPSDLTLLTRTPCCGPLCSRHSSGCRGASATCSPCVTSPGSTSKRSPHAWARRSIRSRSAWCTQWCAWETASATRTTKGMPLPADATPNRSDAELLAAVQQRVATTRASRARRSVVALGAATAVTLLVASGVAVAGNGGDEHHTVAAGEVTTTTTVAPGESLPLTEATTTTTE